MVCVPILFFCKSRGKLGSWKSITINFNNFYWPDFYLVKPSYHFQYRIHCTGHRRIQILDRFLSIFRFEYFFKRLTLWKKCRKFWTRSCSDVCFCFAISILIFSSSNFSWRFKSANWASSISRRLVLLDLKSPWLVDSRDNCVGGRDGTGDGAMLTALSLKETVWTKTNQRFTWVILLLLH